MLSQDVNFNPLEGPTYCVHPAEDSNDKERASVPKMINDLLLSENIAVSPLYESEVGLKFTWLVTRSER